MGWKKINPPKRKTDWRGKKLRLLETPPPCMVDGVSKEPIPLPPIQAGDVVEIYMRRAIGEWSWYLPAPYANAFGARVLDVEWICPNCAAPHHLLVPETWIASGRAEFVEEAE